MARQGDFESLNLLPNRLAVVQFSSEEMSAILGQKRDELELQMDNFNWVAAYLCEEVGIYENEVIDWFRGEALALGNQSPLEIWQGEDGFWKVFEYAQVFKQEVDEDLAAESLSDTDRVIRAQQLGNYALGVIHDGFRVAGVAIDPPGPAHRGMRMQGIHNPDSKNYLFVRRKVGEEVEGYEITMPDSKGKPKASYMIQRVYPPGEEPFFLQTSIVRNGKVESDLIGKPPTVGEVVEFVVPLASEVKKRSLVQMEA